MRAPFPRAIQGGMLRDGSGEGCEHNHLLRALESICNDAGVPTKHKMLTSEGNRRTDLEVLNIGVAQMTGLLVDVSLRQDFIGAGRDGWRTHGKLRNPGNPYQILESAAAQKIRDYRTTYRCNRCFLAGMLVYLGPHPR